MVKKRKKDFVSKFCKAIMDTITKNKEVDPHEPPFRTEVTNLFCKCINVMAYGHQFNFT